MQEGDLDAKLLEDAILLNQTLPAQDVDVGRHKQQRPDANAPDTFACNRRALEDQGQDQGTAECQEGGAAAQQQVVQQSVHSCTLENKGETGEREPLRPLIE